MARLLQKRKSEWDVMMREAIHDAAVSVLTEYGTGGLTMERVAQAAGVATGTLYNYIRNKDELVLYLMERSFAPYHRLLLDIRDSGLPPDEQLERYFRETFAALDEIRRICADIGAPMAQVSLAWLLSRPAVPSVIVGGRNREHVRTDAGAADLRLSRETIRKLDQETEELKRKLGPNINIWW